MTKLVIIVQENKEGLLDVQYELHRSKDYTLKELSTVKALRINAFSNVKFKEQTSFDKG